MPGATLLVVGLLALVAVSMSLTGCGSGRDGASPTGTPSTPPAASLPAPVLHYSDGGRFPLPPILDFQNDTRQPLVIRRLDVADPVPITLAAGGRAFTANGGPFLGRLTDADVRREPGIMVGVYGLGGEPRGRILFAPAYLRRATFLGICLSKAAEPPWIVRDWRDLPTPCPREPAPAPADERQPR